ncbi:hypothetical protein FB451DRAFT_1522774 [Mycena latifolia]|nr:hypothetical protein FB451DRAFT_1522774 [Mycena latifolia]
MNSSSLPKILIVGAGPCGLALALTLRRNGIPVRLIDKAMTSAIGQRGFGIQPRTQEVFKALGVIDQINKQARVIPPFRTYALPEGIVPLKTWESTPTLGPTPDRPYVSYTQPDLPKEVFKTSFYQRNIITLGQDSLETILRATLAAKYSCQVENGKALVSFTHDSAGVDVMIKDEVHGAEEHGRYDFLVGTDGAHGVVRKQLGLSFMGESRPYIKFIIADVRVEGLDEDANPALLHETVSRISGRTDLKITEVQWITNWSPNIRMVEKLSSGRCFVAGDAAHIHSPTGGQGLNTSVQDVFNLGWKMALVVQGYAPLSLLNSYNEERHPVAAEMLRKSTTVLDQTLLMSAGNNKAWERGGPLLMLGVNYRWSTVVVDEQDAEQNDDEKDPYGVQTRGLHAGDRAPDASALNDRQSDSSQLFDVCGVAHHTVLLFSASAERYSAVLEALARYPASLIRLAVVHPAGAEFSPPGVKGKADNLVLEDTEAHAYAAYGLILKAGYDLAVVRPDGVLGAVVRGPEGIGRYFGKIFVA